MTASELARIHNNKLAVYNFKYYGPDGTVYIGLQNGRLVRYYDQASTVIQQSGVKSITGLNINNADPANPVVQISVDGTTITGTGTPANPLVAVIPASGVQSVTDDGNGVVSVDNIDPINPVIQFNGVNVDGVTITGDGTIANPLVAAGASGFTYTKTLVNTTPYTIVPTSGYNTYNVDASGGAIVLNFPTAVGNAAWYIVKKIDSSLNTVTLTPNGVETIDGAVNKVIKFQNTSVDVYSDNSNLYLA